MATAGTEELAFAAIDACQSEAVSSLTAAFWRGPIELWPSVVIVRRAERGKIPWTPSFPEEYAMFHRT
jgi:hypothetical protein